MIKVDVGKEIVIMNTEMIKRLYKDEKKHFRNELEVINKLNEDSPYDGKWNGITHDNINYEIEDIHSDDTIHLFSQFQCNHIYLNDDDITFTNYQEGNSVTLSKENIYALAQYYKNKEESQ